MTFGGILDWLQRNTEKLAVEKYRSKSDRLNLSTEFNLTEGIILPKTPWGYSLQDKPAHVDVFGLRSTIQDGQIIVPVLQPGGALVPFLFDPDSPARAVSAQRIFLDANTPEAGPPLHIHEAQGLHYKSGEGMFSVGEVILQTSDRRTTVWP